MWTCPKCDRELRNQNVWHYCAKVDINDLFKNKNPELEYVFDKLLSEIVEWGEIAVSATKNCVVFVEKRTFLVIRPMKTKLDIKFYAPKEMHHYTVFKCVPSGRKFEVHIRLGTLDELTNEIFKMIKQSFVMK